MFQDRSNVTYLDVQKREKILKNEKFKQTVKFLYITP